jgi:hypothetical protein
MSLRKFHNSINLEPYFQLQLLFHTFVCLFVYQRDIFADSHFNKEQYPLFIDPPPSLPEMCHRDDTRRE